MTTPVTLRFTHDTGPLFLASSDSFVALDPKPSGRGNFFSGPLALLHDRIGKNVIGLLSLLSVE